MFNPFQSYPRTRVLEWRTFHRHWSFGNRGWQWQPWCGDCLPGYVHYLCSPFWNSYNYLWIIATVGGFLLLWSLHAWKRHSASQFGAGRAGIHCRHCWERDVLRRNEFDQCGSSATCCLQSPIRWGCNTAIPATLRQYDGDFQPYPTQSNLSAGHQHPWPPHHQPLT